MAAGKLAVRKRAASRQPARRVPVTTERARATNWVRRAMSMGSGALDWIRERWVAVRW